MRRPGLSCVLFQVAVTAFLASLTSQTVWAQTCGESIDADICIMIDRTGSTSASELQVQQDAVTDLLISFDLLSLDKPHVAIGTFNGPCVTSQSGCPAPGDEARIIYSLDDMYGDDDMACAGDGDMFDAIDCLIAGPTTGQTNLSAAIDVCQAELATFGSPFRPNYIILITDGIPNIPSCSPVDYCDCPVSRAAAAASADAARSAGTQVFAVHYTGTGAGCTLAEDAIAIAFLQSDIADDPSTHYFEGDLGLSGIFDELGDVIDCDDGIACTIDSCDPVTDTCVNTPNNSTCDDGNPCTINTCDPYLGCQTAPVVCDDSVDCTIDTCDPVTGNCVYTPDDSFCDDGLYCNGEETCDATLGCQAGTPVDCDDGAACTIDSCDDVSESCVNSPDDASCDDGNECTTCICDPAHPSADADGCVCTPVADQTTCADDGFSCTDDVCIGGVCTHVPDDSACDDGNECTTCVCDPSHPMADADGCVCTPVLDGTTCTDDGFSCTDDVCIGGVCTHVPDDSACDDGNECTTCVCDPGHPMADANGCVCTPVADGTACTDDGVACTVDECIGGVCVHTPDHGFCDDGNECTTCVCDPSDPSADANGCVCTPVADGTACTDDGVACTVDECVGGVCVHTPDDSACDDGNECTTCVCDPSNPNADANGCVCTPVGDGTLCTDDGVACTVDECVGGVCTHTPDDASCDDGNECTTCVCDPSDPSADANGCVCTPVGDGTLCTDDGVACTVDECIGGVCVHTPDDSACDDGNECTTCVCDPSDPSADANGCVCTPVGDGTPCTDDGMACTVGECVGGVCTQIPDDSACDDGSGCTTCVCDPSDPNADANGCVCAPDDGVCDDGVFCTDDLCDPAHPDADPTTGCVSIPNDANCDDGVDCTNPDLCDPNHPNADANGCVITPVDEKCDDENPCTDDFCDHLGEGQCVNECRTPGIECPDDLVFECDEVGDFGDPIVDDDCSVDPLVECTEEVEPGKLEQESTITRTCTVTNDCGNQASCQQIIEIVDTTPPDIECPPDLVFECDAIGEFGEPVVTDNCDPDPDVTVEVEQIIGDCRKPTVAGGVSPPPKLTITQTFTATDGTVTVASGDGPNEAQCVQIIEIIDTTPPVILNCPENVTTCIGEVPAFDPPSCSDTCGDCTVECTRSDGLPLDSPVDELPLTITCIAIDECDNVSEPCDIDVVLGPCAIPTMSEWGLLCMTLLLLALAKVYFGVAPRRRLA